MADAQPAPAPEPADPLGPAENRPSQTWGQHLFSQAELDYNENLDHRSASILRVLCDRLGRSHWQEEKRRMVGQGPQLNRLPCGQMWHWALSAPHRDLRGTGYTASQHFDVDTAILNRNPLDNVVPPFEDLRFMFMCTAANSCFILGGAINGPRRWLPLPHGRYYQAREFQNVIVIGNRHKNPFHNERMLYAPCGLYHTVETNGSYNGDLTSVDECFIKVGFRTYTDECLDAIRSDLVMRNCWEWLSHKILPDWPYKIQRDEMTHRQKQVAESNNMSNTLSSLANDWRTQHSRTLGAGWFVSCKKYPYADIEYKFGLYFKADAGRWAPTDEEFLYKTMEGFWGNSQYRNAIIFIPGGLYQPNGVNHIWWRVPPGFIVLDSIMPTVMASHNWLVVGNEPVPTPGSYQELKSNRSRGG